jgi:hypothetical protein
VVLISDIQTDVAQRIGLSTAEAAYILPWLTYGYRDLLSKTAFYQESLNIVVNIGVTDVPFSTDIAEIKDVTVIGSLVKPDSVSREEILDLRRYANSGTSQGDIYCYNIEGGMLSVYPAPTQAITMTFYYVPEFDAADADVGLPEAAELSAAGDSFDGTEDLKLDLHMQPLGPLSKCLLYYGLWQASEYDDKKISENSLQYKQLYDGFVTEAKKAVNKTRGRTLKPARTGYPVKRAFPRRTDTYPALSRQEY